MPPTSTAARANRCRPPWRRRDTLGLTVALAVGIACQRPAGQQNAAVSATASTPAPSTARSTAAAPATRITVTRERVGAARVDRIAREIHLPAAAAAAGTPGRPRWDLVERFERRVEIRAVTEARVAAIAVEYRQAEVSRDGQRAPDPRAGRRFLVAIRDGMLTVTDEKEAAVAEPIAALVAADHAFLDAPFPLAPFLPEPALTVGTEVEPSHDAVLSLVSGTGDFDVKTLKLTFEGTEGAGAAARARFRFTAQFRVTLGDRPIELDLGGKAYAEVATGRVRSLEATGTAIAVARGPGEEPAKGDARIVLTSVYE